jgi:glycosyltransferase involved in cell wall biosynthesis
MATTAFRTQLAGTNVKEIEKAMKILLITTDLYKTTGGGQTVYKKIIEATPDLEFYYFQRDESATASRPANAHCIPLAERRHLHALVPPPYPRYKLETLIEADQIARSVAGESFDIVDTPDFESFGSALRAAFAHHQVNVGRIVLAMHGNISTSMALNWGSADNSLLERRLLERAQFEAADAVYSISQRYIREWQAIVNRTVHYMDPAHFVSAELQPLNEIDLHKKPSIYCIGRSERLKGNDLFVELVRWLKQESFDSAAHIGDSDFSFQGISSAYLLENIAKHRGIAVPSQPSMNRGQLAKLYGQRSIVVLPVRYDTLNLVALEALFSGCPVAISTKAGVCDYLDEFHPDLPYIKIDFDNFYSAVSDLQVLVDHYDEHREKLAAYLTQHSVKPQVSLDMRSFYEDALKSTELRATSSIGASVVPYEVRGRSYKAQLLKVVRKLLPITFYHALMRLILAPRSWMIEKIKKSGYFGDAKFFGFLIDSKAVQGRLTKIAEFSEHNRKQLRKKLDKIYNKASNPLYRCNFWKDIARIERMLGNELIAVTYELRILRLLGEDKLGLLPGVIATLNKHGLTQEAMAAQALYADPSKAEENVYAYLKAAYQRNLIRQDKPLQVLDDRRTQTVPRVSVIVSLYKAADKLNYFLTALSQQTLVRRGEVEIILVDSGSPTNEREVIEAFLQKTPLNVAYARSAERETIQAAWNRGIGLAKAPYLVFLGADETLYPEGLEVLADELDQNPEVDWVMANSLVTSVDEHGVHEHDIMSYDRTGACKDHTYLETCYLSWVGGMYRKTLHERFGYYDETFGAAGDTEIKNRILPYINVKFIPKMLGLFINYPDGQTTASPKAEIEDLRAWYMHRTPGGLRYAFENRPIEEAEKQLCLALGYRKSYCGHMSCDIEYATYLAQHIKARNLNSEVASRTLPGLEKMLLDLRTLEFAQKEPSRLGSMNILFTAWRNASRYQAQHLSYLNTGSSPCYSVLNDNRYEQHSWLWKSN